jgi:hypothetical protein
MTNSNMHANLNPRKRPATETTNKPSKRARNGSRPVEPEEEDDSQVVMGLHGVEEEGNGGPGDMDWEDDWEDEEGDWGTAEGFQTQHDRDNSEYRASLKEESIEANECLRR